MKRVLFITLFIFLLFSTIGNAGPSKSATIEITEMGQNYQLTVPVSRLVMTIPKGVLEQKENRKDGSTESPRYFYFEGKGGSFHLVLSGWFESEKSFPGIKKLWEEKKTNFNRSGQQDPQDVSFEKIGDWDVIIYESPMSGATISNISAHLVQAGTWIELHLSNTSDRPKSESRAKLVDLLKTIQVKEKE